MLKLDGFKVSTQFCSMINLFIITVVGKEVWEVNEYFTYMTNLYTVLTNI